MATSANPLVAKAQTAAQHALDRLKSKFPAAVPQDEVHDFVFISAELENQKLFRMFRFFMDKDSEVAINEVDKTYRYKPPYNIRSPEQLIAYFQSQSDIQAIEVAKLKKGWADCEPSIDKLETEHKLVVIRNKKDNTPRVIFADDPTLFAPLDKDFVDLWMGIQLPPKDDIIRFLIQAKRTPAGQVAENKAVAKTKAKARKSRQSNKQTNKHMAGLFRDYSALRPKGK